MERVPGLKFWRCQYCPLSFDYSKERGEHYLRVHSHKEHGILLASWDHVTELSPPKPVPRPNHIQKNPPTPSDDHRPGTSENSGITARKHGDQDKNGGDGNAQNSNVTISSYSNHEPLSQANKRHQYEDDRRQRQSRRMEKRPFFGTTPPPPPPPQVNSGRIIMTNDNIDNQPHREKERNPSSYPFNHAFFDKSRCVIRLDNLHPEATMKNIRKHVENVFEYQFDNDRIVIKYDKSGKGTGTVHLIMETHVEATLAKNELDKYHFMGRPIEVSIELY